jgi:BNR/Asp-box repeat
VTARQVVTHIRKMPTGGSLSALAVLLVLAGLGFPSGASVLAQPRAVYHTGSVLSGTWHPIGPTVDGRPVGDAAPLAGRVTAFAVVPAAVPIEVIGTLGGIWKKTGTRPWRDVTSARWPTTAIGSVTVDPANPNVLYAGTGYDDVDDSDVQPGAGILKSTNGGKTWALLPASESLLRGYGVTGLAVDPENDQIVVAAANNGVFRSVNGGGSWSEVVAVQPGPYGVAEVRLAVDSTTGVMLAGVAQSQGIRAMLGARAISTGHALYRSTDGGRTWSAYALNSGTRPGDVVVPAIATGKGSAKTYAYALNSTGNSATGVYTSGDGGRTWKLRTAQDVTTKASIGQIAVDSLSPRHAYFAQGDGPFEYT